MKEPDVHGILAEIASDELDEVQRMADLSFWLLTVDGLKQKGLLNGGPTIHRAGMEQVLEACRKRGVEPRKDTDTMLRCLASVVDD